MASRQPVDVRPTTADELRILGRGFGPILIISYSAVLLSQHKPGAGDGVQRRRSGRPRHVGPLGTSRRSSARVAPSLREMRYVVTSGVLALRRRRVIRGRHLRRRRRRGGDGRCKWVSSPIWVAVLRPGGWIRRRRLPPRVRPRAEISLFCYIFSSVHRLRQQRRASI